MSKRDFLTVNCEVNVEKRTYNIELEDLACETEEEWNKLDEKEKERRVQLAIDGEHEQPCWIAVNFEKII